MHQRPCISIVMPYYKNERTVTACIQSFASQHGAQACEIIVVDDGSPVPAKEVLKGLHVGIELRMLHTNRAGQSAATNQGIQAARGTIILLTCADIIASPRLVVEHLQAHMEHEHIGVMGYIPYAPSIKMTPFMQYLATTGVQFDFAGIGDPDDASPLKCYAPNLSVGRAQLMQVGGFDANFIYGYQDTDLGIRLREAGTRFVYRNKALGYHDHPNDLLRYISRQRQIGRSTVPFLRKYPVGLFLDPTRTRAQYFVPMLPRFKSLLTEALRIEALLRLQPAALRTCKKQLFNLYGLLLNLATYQGAMEQAAELEALLGMSLHNLGARALVDTACPAQTIPCS